MGIHEGILNYAKIVSEKMKELSPVISWRLSFKKVEIEIDTTYIYLGLDETKLSFREYQKLLKNILLIFPFLKYRPPISLKPWEPSTLIFPITIKYKDEFDSILEEMDIDSIKLLLILQGE